MFKRNKNQKPLKKPLEPEKPYTIPVLHRVDVSMTPELERRRRREQDMDKYHLRELKTE